MLLANAQLASPSLATVASQDKQVALQAAIKANDCKTVLQIVAAQIALPNFAGLPEQDRQSFYHLGFECAYQEHQSELALNYVEEATKLPGAPQELWQARLGLELRAKHLAAAVSTAETLPSDMADVLNVVKVAYWRYLTDELKSEPKLRQRLLKVLASHTYLPAELGTSSDYFRWEYAKILADGGDKPGAAALVTLIDDPKALMQISLDTRLREFVPANFDARFASELHLARMREVASAHPGLMSPHLDFVFDLLFLDRGEEALATLEAIDPDKADRSNFSDKTDQLRWWWDFKARAYALLGRYDEAVAAYTRAMALNEANQPNISQTINLAALQLRFNHPADALITLAPVMDGKVPASPYGLMQFRVNHGCASFKTGKRGEANTDLAFLREHVVDAPAALTWLQLCMGDIDGAAVSVIKRLETPDERPEALAHLSDYAESPATLPKDPYAAGVVTLKARADVKEAIARAGGIRSFNVSR